MELITKAFIKIVRCEMCVYHAASEVRKLAARRGTFSQSILIPKKNGVVIKNNANLLSQSKFVDLTSIFNLHVLTDRVDSEDVFIGELNSY